MKRIFRYYSYKQDREMTEKECRKALGEEKFNAMKTEAIETMGRTNEKECVFWKHTDPEHKPAFMDWCVMEYTGLYKHSIAVTVLAIFVCAAMEIIRLLCGPVQWVRPLFTGFGVLMFLLSGGALLRDLGGGDPWKLRLSYPLLLAGFIITGFAKHLPINDALTISVYMIFGYTLYSHFVPAFFECPHQGMTRKLKISFLILALCVICMIVFPR